MPNPSQDFSGFAFVAQPLDRADALRDDPAALAALWTDATVLVLDEDGNAFADADGQPFAVRGGQLAPAPGTAVFLGLAPGGGGWFGVDAALLGSALDAPQRIDLRRAAASWDARAAGAFAYARGMSYWQARTRFCGVCGHAVAFRRAGFTGHCDGCGTDHYPRVDPAVIVAVSDGARLLLGRQASWVERRYSVVAGFVEPGESLEQTVAREVFEETQVRVGGCSYLGAQPWPFPGALMLGFQAWADPAEQPRVNGELEDARWFSRDEVGAAIARDDADDGAGIRLPPPISIARSLIEHWYHATA
jgi:NAD+ diphosphatase